MKEYKITIEIKTEDGSSVYRNYYNNANVDFNKEVGDIINSMEEEI
jgi:hypothetical protein